MTTKWNLIGAGDVAEVPDPNDPAKIIGRIYSVGSGQWNWRAIDQAGKEHKGIVPTGAEARLWVESIIEGRPLPC